MRCSPGIGAPGDAQSARSRVRGRGGGRCLHGPCGSSGRGAPRLNVPAASATSPVRGGTSPLRRLQRSLPELTVDRTVDLVLRKGEAIGLRDHIGVRFQEVPVRSGLVPYNRVVSGIPVPVDEIEQERVLASPSASLWMCRS